MKKLIFCIIVLLLTSCCYDCSDRYIDRIVSDDETNDSDINTPETVENVVTGDSDVLGYNPDVGTVDIFEDEDVEEDIDEDIDEDIEDEVIDDNNETETMCTICKEYKDKYEKRCKCRKKHKECDEFKHYCKHYKRDCKPKNKKDCKGKGKKNKKCHN
jgi:hypothetical protein